MQKPIELFSQFTFIERGLFIFFAISCCVAFLSIASLFVTQFTREIPIHGGNYTEGILGLPATINPALATTTTDQSIAKLLYSGIQRKSSWNAYIDDLGSCMYAAKAPTVTCTLRKSATFHDGKPVTTDDVIFTVETIQALGDASPWKDSFTGVTVRKDSEYAVTFTLPKKFSGFDEALTVGILPKHIWRDTPPNEMESRTSDESYLIGSGPYVLKKQNSKDDAIESYTLSSFSDFTLGKPFIDTLTLVFYQDEHEIVNAFEKSAIDGFILDSSLVSSEYSNIASKHITPIVHPDVYGIFTKSSASESVNLSKLKKSLTSKDISGFGIPWSKPLPPWDSQELLDIIENYDIVTSIVPSSNEPLAKTNNQTPLPVVTTVNQGILVDIANLVFNELTSLGIESELQIYDFSGFKNSVIPKRSFGYLIFGSRYRHISDAYAYWNSNERTDPGLNITELINQTITKDTESLLDHSLSKADQEKLYTSLQSNISQQNVFLPLFLDRDLYVTKNKRSPAMGKFIYNPSQDRFNMVHSWYNTTNTKLSF
jgi:peptide/nickel transport system substrate-binding protein